MKRQVGPAPVWFLGLGPFLLAAISPFLKQDRRRQGTLVAMVSLLTVVEGVARVCACVSITSSH